AKPGVPPCPPVGSEGEAVEGEGAAAGAAGEVAGALGEAGELQAVEHAAGGALLDREAVGEFAGGQGFVAGGGAGAHELLQGGHREADAAGDHRKALVGGRGGGAGFQDDVGVGAERQDRGHVADAAGAGESAAGQALRLGGAAAEAETGPYDPVAAGQAGQHGQRGEAAGGLVQRPAGGDQQVGAAAEGRDGAAEHGRLPQQPVVVVRLDEPERDLGVLLGPALGGQQQTAQRDPYRVGGGREAQHVRQLAAERIVDGAQAGDHGVGGAAPVEGGG